MFKWEIKQTDIVKMRKSLLKLQSMIEHEAGVLSYNNAASFRAMLLRNILTQKFATTYAPYSPRYAEWKTQKMLLGSHFWKLFGDVLENITLHRRNDGWFAGIPEGIYDSGGKSWFATKTNRVGKKKPVSMYAIVMEEGLNSHPARPMFGPTLDEYAAGEWIRQAEQSLKRINEAWR
ncbi:MAG: hypothetical protein RBQ87_01270 [Candidatus Cloacimonadaceae bacterium]|jgi:hypothetical protein|nr:hypothetical protein [Candidatus Cloacimonadaceae bacterium]